VAQAGRGRWKIENENNNVLKTKGSHVEHNFGHGQQYLAAVMLSLNLLAFLFHTVLDLQEGSCDTTQAAPQRTGKARIARSYSSATSAKAKVR
jgi:hypothetical protein